MAHAKLCLITLGTRALFPDENLLTPYWVVLRHSQAALREFMELPAPLVAHRAAADVAILDDIVKVVYSVNLCAWLLSTLF